MTGASLLPQCVVQARASKCKVMQKFHSRARTCRRHSGAPAMGSTSVSVGATVHVAPGRTEASVCKAHSTRHSCCHQPLATFTDTSQGQLMHGWDDVPIQGPSWSAAGVAADVLWVCGSQGCCCFWMCGCLPCSISDNRKDASTITGEACTSKMHSLHDLN